MYCCISEILNYAKALRFSSNGVKWELQFCKELMLETGIWYLEAIALRTLLLKY